MSSPNTKPSRRVQVARRGAAAPSSRVALWFVGLIFLGSGFYAFADSAGGGRKLLQGALNAGTLTAESATSLLASYGISATTKAGDLEIREHCRAEDASFLAQRFLNLTKEVPFWTACPADAWLDELARLSPGGKTVIDIGCNKGYSSSRFFALWAPELGFAPHTIRTKRPDVLCGTCGDCNDKVEASPAEETSGEPVSVYCVEPSLRNFASLVSTRDAFFSSATPEYAQWYLLNAAVSNDTGTVNFPRGCVDELCSLEGNSDGTRTRDVDYIPLVTVDALLRDLKIPHVDVLKIDTEGYDATVLAGALEALGRGAIDVVSFEYHEVGVWRDYSLREVTQRLAGFDFVCYYDGKPTLTRITGCWDDKLEAYAWSNVVCVRRSHVLYPAMERMSTRYELFEAEYFGTQGKAASAAENATKLL